MQREMAPEHVGKHAGVADLTFPASIAASDS
jgi:hypothetical protein